MCIRENEETERNKSQLKSSPLSSLLSLTVLWVPAVCRQMQRVWTFNHGHGESDVSPHPALVTIPHYKARWNWLGFIYEAPYYTALFT